MNFKINGDRLKIGGNALGAMLRHRQFADAAAEAGGVLLGRCLPGGVVVDDATEPQATDRATRFTFHRSEAHQTLIDAAHDASGGTCGYLGEWHTHAEPDPTPSQVDIDDWRRRALEDSYDGDALVHVIVGTDCLRAWRCDRSGHVVQLEAA